jgi:hypothetical protein
MTSARARRAKTEQSARRLPASRAKTATTSTKSVRVEGLLRLIHSSMRVTDANAAGAER